MSHHNHDHDAPHAHEHVEHEHEHTHDDGTVHSHPLVHVAGLADEGHAHSH
jgi:hypothetical protein